MRFLKNEIEKTQSYQRVYAIQLNQYNRHSTLMSAYKNINDERFRYYILKQKSDVFHSMKSFFKQAHEKAAK